jgi:hypothetical protein
MIAAISSISQMAFNHILMDSGYVVPFGAGGRRRAVSTSSCTFSRNAIAFT